MAIRNPNHEIRKIIAVMFPFRCSLDLIKLKIGIQIESFSDFDIRYSDFSNAHYSPSDRSSGRACSLFVILILFVIEKIVPLFVYDTLQLIDHAFGQPFLWVTLAVKMKIDLAH